MYEPDDIIIISTEISSALKDKKENLTEIELAKFRRYLVEHLPGYLSDMATNFLEEQEES